MAEKQLIVLLTIQAQDYASKVIEQNEAGLASLSSTLLSTGTAMTAGLTLPIVGAGAALFHFASDWQTTMMQIANNTNMGTANVKAMNSTIMQLGAESGASLNNLAEGFQHAFNLTQSAIASQAELKVANEAAVATGDNVANTTNTLANAMHEYGYDVSSATTTTGQYNDILANSNHIMGVMHLATTLSNTTLDQWSQNTARATATAANLHVPIEQVSAAVATLSKHGFPDLAEAQTQVVNIMTHMIHPAAAAEKEIQRLSKTTGVDLVGDFSAAGLSTKGLTGVMQDLQQAYMDTGLSSADATSETMKLLNAQRGGLGMATLLGTGYADYNSILAALSNTQQVNTITEDQYQQALQTAGVQLHIAEQRAREMAITLGTALLPAMTSIISGIGDVAGFLSGHLGPILQEMPHWVGTLTVTFLALTAAAGPLLIVGAGLVAMLAAITGPVALVAIGIAALIAVVVTLYQNWGAITERVPQLATALDAVKVALSLLWTTFSYVVAGMLVYTKLWYDGITNGAKALIETFKGLGNVLSDLANPAKWGQIKGDAINALDAMKHSAVDFLTNIKDAPGDVQNLAQSINSWINKSNDAADATNRSTSASMAHIAAVNNEIDAAQQMASAADSAAQSTGTWANAQDFLDQSAKAAQGAVGVWQQKVTDAQGALKILQDQQAAGTPLNDLQKQQYDDLTWYIARMNDGIKNDLNPTIVATQDAEAKYTKTMDDLNQALKDHKIDQDQYNAAAQAAGDAAKANLDDNGKLMVSMDDLSGAVKALTDSLHAMLIQMGLIPEDRSTTITVPGADDSMSKIQQLNNAIDGTPSSFTVQANVNISGAIASIAQLDRMMPHSPAKEGPLSQLPNWDALFQGIQASADKYGSQAVSDVKGYVDAIKSVYDALGSELTFSTQASAFQAAGTALPSNDFLSQLKFSSEHAVTSLGDSAALMSTDFVTAAKNYSDAVKSGWDALGGALSFASAYATDIANASYVAVPDSVVSQLKFSSEHMVQSLGDSAATMSTDFVSAATTYAGAVKAGWDALGGALSFASNYATALAGSGVMLPDPAFISEITTEAEAIVQQLGQSGQTLGQDLTTAATNFSDAAKSGFDALNGALSFLSNVASAMSSGALLSTTDLSSVITALGSLTTMALTMLTSVATDFNQKLAPAAAAAGVSMQTASAQIKTDADLMKSAFDVLGSALGFLQSATTFGQGQQLGSGKQAVTMQNITSVSGPFVNMLMTLVETITQAFIQAAVAMGTKGLNAAKQFATSVKPVIDMIQPALDAFKAMESEGVLTKTAAEQFVTNFETALKAISALPSASEGPLKQARAFAVLAMEIAAAIEQGVEILKPFGINVTINGITVGQPGAGGGAPAYSGTITLEGGNSGSRPITNSGGGSTSSSSSSSSGSGSGSGPIYLSADLHIDGQKVGGVVDKRMFTNQRTRIRYQ